MGGYAGDSYEPGTDKAHSRGAIVLVSLVLAFVFFLGVCVGVKVQ